MTAMQLEEDIRAKLATRDEDGLTALMENVALPYPRDWVQGLARRVLSRMSPDVQLFWHSKHTWSLVPVRSFVR